MRILMVGDIVGSPGRLAFAQVASRYKADKKVDFIVANAENAAAGKGVTPKLAAEIFAAGADVLTMGDHVWDQKELPPHLPSEPRIIRPANFAPECPGKGWYTAQTPFGPVTVLQLIGRTFMPPNDSPFHCVDAFLKRPELGKIVLVDIHAEATSEKVAMGWYLDGRVSAVVGTHTHVQTADERILPKGTGYLTDLGMTGPYDSVIGRDKESVLRKFVTGMPSKFDVATDDIRLNGVLLTVDEKTGRTTSIKRVQETIGGG
ncbi:MAG TPA: TIGR00282 family metallophosphoesterase [Verrucomicrobia bacterium]|nr:MAG: metallophosphoesterase [Lentisphaerae bacterium GWF2_57_35]HBA83445.1 TIGR00282 family metallophosphoesterase [Verrucomicrobiota bacterium]